MIPLVAGIMAGAMGSGHRDRPDRQVQDLPAGRHRVHGRRRWSRCRSSSRPTPRCGRWCRSWSCWASAWASTSSRSSWPCRTPSPRGRSGVATSSVTFFRQMGGTLGAAAFLSILFSRLRTEIPGRRARRHSLTRIAGAAGGRAAAGRATRPADTSAIDASAGLVMPFRVGFSNSLDLVFLVAAGGRGRGLLRPAVPARSSSCAPSRASRPSRSAASRPPGTAVTPDVEADQPTQASAPRLRRRRLRRPARRRTRAADPALITTH